MFSIHYLITYFLVVICFIAFDSIWLGLVSKHLHRKYLNIRQELSTSIVAYLTLLLGEMVFVIIPAIQNDDLGYALLYGGIYGFFLFSTYNLMHISTTSNWKNNTAFIDILWGSFICSIISALGFLIVTLIS